MILSEKDFPLPIGTFTATSGWLEPLNSQPMYQIKPLEWYDNKTSPLSFVADTEFSVYKVEEDEDGKYSLRDGWEEQGVFDSLEAAKATAETHWQERVKQCLVEVGESRTNYGQDEPLGSQHLDHEKRFFNPK